MKKIKLGIIGVGNMGTAHLKSILDGKCPEIDVTAVADIDSDRLEAAKRIYAPLWKLPIMVPNTKLSQGFRL